MTTDENKYDLKERTYLFAKNVRIFIKKIPRTISNIEDDKQLIRSSGSVGANYIEVNNHLSQKDCLLGIKICRKESEESIYWLRLIYLNNSVKLEEERNVLIQEATELMKIMSSIMRKLSLK